METLKNFFSPEVIWFLSGIILLLLEFTLPGLFIFFFGVGAIVVGLICLFFEPSFTLQLAIFLVTSTVLLFSLRKWLAKVFLGRKSGPETELIDALDNFVGEKAVALENISPDKTGTVELHGTGWQAESEDSIKKGEKVEVTGKKNLVLYVKKTSHK